MAIGPQWPDPAKKIFQFPHGRAPTLPSAKPSVQRLTRIPKIFADAREDAGAVAGTIPAPSGGEEMHTPLAYTIAHACSVASIGRTELYEEIKLGRLRAVSAGAARLCSPMTFVLISMGFPRSR